MLKNAKAKGAKRERQFLKMLEKKEYLCVKSGGSLGIFDIVAVPKYSGESVLLVQVKSNRISGKERKAIEKFKVGGVKMIAIKPDYKKWKVYMWVETGKHWYPMDINKWGC